MKFKAIFSDILIFILISFNICLKADELTENLTITFVISDPTIEVPADNDIVNITAKPQSSYFIPGVKLKKSGYTFMGWTADGIYGYEQNDVFLTETENMVFEPVFVDNNDKKFYTYTYRSVLDGEEMDLSELISDGNAKKNQIIKPEIINIPNNKAKHIGWTYNGYIFLPENKMVMPAKDVTFEAIWHHYHVLTYYAGDVSGIVGATKAVMDLREGGKKELANTERFSRLGYEIAGWHCEYDGLDYKILETYTMPDADVDFYAIWEPINYNVVFKVGVTGVASIKIQGKTDTTIICPEMTVENEGYTFGGWKYGDKIYMPGDEFLIEGQMPGMGIALTAVWVKNE